MCAKIYAWCWQNFHTGKCRFPFPFASDGKWSLRLLFSILNQMDCHLVQIRKENCHHHHISFSLKENKNLFFGVYSVTYACFLRGNFTKNFYNCEFFLQFFSRHLRGVNEELSRNPSDITATVYRGLWGAPQFRFYYAEMPLGRQKAQILASILNRTKLGL